MNKSATILELRGEIKDDWKASLLIRQIRTAPAGRPVKLRVDSCGGDIATATRIGKALASHAGGSQVIVRGACHSAASVMAMSADKITMDAGSTMLVHRGRTVASGTQSAMRQAVDTLGHADAHMAGTYCKRTRKSLAVVERWMDGETVFAAGEAVAVGLADEVRDPIATWDAALAEKVAAGLSRAAAVVALVAEDDELHTAYLAAYNERAHARARR